MKVLITMFIIFTIVILGCTKSSKYPPLRLDQSLRSNVWQLYSATKHYNNGNISNYNGTLGDSILFQYSFDSNINIVYTDIISYVHNKTIKTNGYRFLDWSLSNPSPYDTIVCSKSWQPYCSDTLFVSAFTDNSVVINVKFKDSIGSGLEIDSLKSIRTLWQ